jgi:hypothetical protein
MPNELDLPSLLVLLLLLVLDQRLHFSVPKFFCLNPFRLPL